MARIAGVNIPTNKRVLISLRYIFGIGPQNAKDICEKLGIPAERRVNQLMDMAAYRGLRHRRGLPVRGQRTHTNARTRKGKAVAIAGKKKVTK